MKGAANVSLPMSGIAGIEIPLPPIERQLSIVDLVKRLENEHEELEDEGEIQLDIVKQLRQAILQEAVEGKLTADWRKKHPVKKGDPEFDAGALLEKIRAEKERLVREGKIRKEKPLTPIEEGEKPFGLPEGWRWCQLQQCSINKDDARQPISQVERERKEKIYPYYGASGIIDKIGGYTHEGQNLLIGEDGANLIARSTPIAFIADGNYWVNNHAHVLGFTDKITMKFVEIHINAIDLKLYITGGFQPKLNQVNLNQIIMRQFEKGRITGHAVRWSMRRNI